MQLKEIDAKILRELLINGRSHFATIAEKLQITEKTVWNRYKFLKKMGVIIGATTHVDYQRIGYGTYVHFTIKMNPSKVTEAIKKIEKLPGLYMVYKGIQSYNLMVGLSIKNQNEIDKIKNKLHFITLADEIVSEIWLGVKNFPENLQIFFDKKQFYQPLKDRTEFEDKKDCIEIKVDAIDLEIIDLLSFNGRLSFSAIAKEIGKSIDTVSKRYKKMVKCNILKVVIQIDPIKLGYKALMMFNLLFSAKVSLVEKRNEIVRIPDVIHFVKIRGRFDCSVYAFVQDIEQLLDMQEKISRLNGLLKIEITSFKMFNVWPMPKQYISTF